MKSSESSSVRTVKGFNPLCSLLRFLGRAAIGRMSGMPRYIRRPVTFPDGESFTVFRTIAIRGDAPRDGSAVFTVRFRPKNMSVEANRIFSLVPIPFFTGLPGFRAKCWMENTDTGYCSGVYQWDSEDAAHAYARSFAVRFMTRRSEPGSVAWGVHRGMTLDEFMEGKVSGHPVK